MLRWLRSWNIRMRKKEKLLCTFVIMTWKGRLASKGREKITYPIILIFKRSSCCPRDLFLHFIFVYEEDAGTWVFIAPAFKIDLTKSIWLWKRIMQLRFVRQERGFLIINLIFWALKEQSFDLRVFHGCLKQMFRS